MYNDVFLGADCILTAPGLRGAGYWSPEHPIFLPAAVYATFDTVSYVAVPIVAAVRQCDWQPIANLQAYVMLTLFGCSRGSIEAAYDGRVTRAGPCARGLAPIPVRLSDQFSEMLVLRVQGTVLVLPLRRYGLTTMAPVNVPLELWDPQFIFVRCSSAAVDRTCCISSCYCCPCGSSGRPAAFTLRLHTRVRMQYALAYDFKGYNHSQ